MSSRTQLRTLLCVHAHTSIDSRDILENCTSYRYGSLVPRPFVLGVQGRSYHKATPTCLCVSGAGGRVLSNLATADPLKKTEKKIDLQ